MSAAKQELKKVVGQLSEDESRILLKFAEWLRDQQEELTDKELTILRPIGSDNYLHVIMPMFVQW